MAFVFGFSLIVLFGAQHQYPKIAKFPRRALHGLFKAPFYVTISVQFTENRTRGELALGAVPTATANMTAVTKLYGPSPRVFIIVPLIGAFFIDLANAIVIPLFVGWYS